MVPAVDCGLPTATANLITSPPTGQGSDAPFYWQRFSCSSGKHTKTVIAVGVRAIRVKIVCDQKTLEHLWRTHKLFNDQLRVLLEKLFAMRRGELGANATHRKVCKRWMEFVLERGAKDAPYLLNAVSIPKWKPATAMKMLSWKPPKDPTELKKFEARFAELDRAIKALERASTKGELAYEKNDLRAGLPDSIFQPMLRDAVAYMSGHEELLALWHTEHKAWLKQKAEWESDAEHKKYLALRPLFDGFEKAVGGKATKRRGRWHLYMKWLADNPALAGWRGGPKRIVPLDAAAKARIAKSKPWKQRGVEAEEFWKANPELAAIDRLHGTYEREFIRRRKTKKNPDGFDHRPTFTQPHAALHPRWVLFNAPQTSPQGYRNLAIPQHKGDAGGVELQVITGPLTGGEYPAAFLHLRFLADSRLSCFKPEKIQRVMRKGKNAGKTKESETFQFRDEHLGKWRDAKISGAKLLLSDIVLDEGGGLKSATPYIVFACTIEDEPITELAKKISWSDTGETTNTGKARRKKSVPDGLITCAVDLGIRNLGFITIAKVGAGKKASTHRTVQVLRSRNQWLADGPDLAAIGGHKREIKSLRRQRGKPVKGEESHSRLQKHIDDMGVDRFKKAARAIVNFALNVSGTKDKTGKPYPRADAIVLEKLAGFIPDAEKERGINRALASWNRGQLVQRIKEVAAGSGFKGRVYEVHPAGSSQCCSKCGKIGRRYSIVRDNKTGAAGIRFGWVEKLFACECGYRANADHNASVNLHHIFVEGSSEGVAAFYEWKAKPDAEKRKILETMDENLQPVLQRENGLPVDRPF